MNNNYSQKKKNRQLSGKGVYRKVPHVAIVTSILPLFTSSAYADYNNYGDYISVINHTNVSSNPAVKLINYGTIDRVNNSGTLISLDKDGIYNGATIHYSGKIYYGKIQNIYNSGQILGSVTKSSSGITNLSSIGLIQNDNLISGTNGISNDTSAHQQTIISNVLYTLSTASEIQTIRNNGRIIGTDGQGISTVQLGELINNGVIEGSENGLRNINVTVDGRVKGNINTVTNTKNGVITGLTSNGLLNEGTIGIINNYGTIKGDVAAIDTASGTVTNDIYNYGLLDGHVVLGSNTLRLLHDDSAVADQPLVRGNITGTTGSSVVVGDNAVSTIVTSYGNVDVDNISVLDKATLNLNSSYNWIAQRTVTNQGTIGLSDASAASSATLQGVANGIVNQGVIDLTHYTGTGDVLTINGRYQSANGRLVVDTYWDNHAVSASGYSTSDLLHITGDADGVTTVSASNRLIKGAYTTNITQYNQVWSADVVQVDGNSSANSFVGESNIQDSGLYATLHQKTANTWAWTTKVLATPTSPVTVGNIDNYAPATSAYVQMPAADMELGYSTLATLHERESEHQVLSWDKCSVSCQPIPESQPWIRFVGGHFNFKGTGRLSMDGNQFLFQAGKDLSVSENPEDGSRVHKGGYLSYARSDLNFKDQYSAVNGILSENKVTGKGSVDAFSIGGYHTYYDKNGSYLDMVGQLSYLYNRYRPRDGGNRGQNGIGALVSAEAGRPFEMINETVSRKTWIIEPQAQLSYQLLALQDFYDGYRNVDQPNQSGLRGRIGVRLARNAENDRKKTSTFYMTANILHDFMKNSTVHVGNTHIAENYQDTWWSLGSGIQHSLTKSAYIYADLRYEQSFHQPKRTLYRATAGVKFSWQ